MAFDLKVYGERRERFNCGHRMCAGCSSPIAVRAVMRALHPEDRAVVTVATGCLEVSSCIYPYTSWDDSFLHTAFENASATCSGIVAAYNALKKNGRLKESYKFITFGGDGGTYDIGFQSLSGAMERGTDMVYVCYDNEAYMNTGIQSSSSTPQYTNTTTTTVGIQQSQGKARDKKDITNIMIAHRIPYVAQTTFWGNLKDIYEKAEKAIYTHGPTYLNILAPCPRGWRYVPADLIKICKLAMDTCVWPVYEVIEGKWILNYIPKRKLPVEDYLRTQGRFKHLFKTENRHLITIIQSKIDKQWNELIERCS